MSYADTLDVALTLLRNIVQTHVGDDEPDKGEIKRQLADLERRLVTTADSVEDNSASVAAIQFALETDEGMTFLRCWNQGDFGAIREEWPEAPEAVFIGADPLYKPAQ